MEATRVAIALFPLMFVVLVLPVIVGVYVYRDAKNRGMNAVLWTLVAALAPSAVGLIVYLVVRGSYSNLHCPRCSERVEEDYLACPQCGVRLRATCPNCATPVEPAWEICPKCARPLTRSYEGVEPPVRPKDGGLWKILALIVLVPVLLIALLGLNFSVASKIGSSTLREVTAAELLQTSQDGAQLQAWLDSFEGAEADGAHALVYTEPGLDGGKNDYYYLVYVPGVDGRINRSSFGLTTGFLGFDIAFELDFSTEGTVLEKDGVDGKLFCIACAAQRLPELRVSFNGRELACTVEQVNYNPTTFAIFSDQGLSVGADVAASYDVYTEERALELEAEKARVLREVSGE